MSPFNPVTVTIIKKGITINAGKDVGIELEWDYITHC